MMEDKSATGGIRDMMGMVPTQERARGWVTVMSGMAKAQSAITMMVTSDRERVLARAKILENRLRLDLIDASECPGAGAGAGGGVGGATLVMTDDHLELADDESKPGPGVMVDWRDFLGRGKHGLSRRQPLARAIGKDARTILDATAGLGRDAAMLAALGYQVRAIERSPIVFALLEDGLQRSLNDPIMRDALGGRLRLEEGDARAILAKDGPAPDAVLIDPMYPPKKKSSAMARKSIRIVRQVVGADDDAAELLAIARRVARRVVVKRADDSPPLVADPTATITGNTVRYDVYAR